MPIRLNAVESWPSFVLLPRDCTKVRTRIMARDNQSDDVFRWEANAKYDDQSVAIATARNMALPCIVVIQRPTSMATYGVDYAWGIWHVVPVK